VSAVVDMRGAKVVELVCESCGYRHCAQGVLMCGDAQKAGFCTREEFERRHVDAKRQKTAVAA